MHQRQRQPLAPERNAGVLDILARRTANSALLVGPPGVGKSSIIRGIAQRFASFQSDPANAHEPFNFTRCIVVGGLISRDAEFVQPARLRLGVKDHNVMSMHRKAVGTGQTGGASADDRNGFPRGCGPLIRVTLPRHQRVGGMALQAPNLDWFAFGEFPHAGLFAQILGWANAGAHAAKNVLVENRLCRGFGCSGADLANEKRDVDRGRTGGYAGRVVTKVTPIRRNRRFMIRISRMQIGKRRV